MLKQRQGQYARVRMPAALQSSLRLRLDRARQPAASTGPGSRQPGCPCRAAARSGAAQHLALALLVLRRRLRHHLVSENGLREWWSTERESG